MTAVLAAAGGTSLALLPDDRAHEVAPATTDTRLVWARGSALYVGGEPNDVGHPVLALARTSLGYVFADNQGRVFSYVNGSVNQVGATSAKYPRLVTDPSGPLAGWVESGGGQASYIVVDLANGATWRFDAPAAKSSDQDQFYALDSHTAYWDDPRGTVAVNIPDGATRVVDTTRHHPVRAARGKVLLFQADDGARVGADFADAVRLGALDGEIADGSMATISPTGRWVSLDADQPAVYDTATGTRITMDVDGRWFATGYEWLDDTTLAMIAVREEDPKADAELLTCAVPQGDCRPAANLGPWQDLEGHAAFPVGEKLG
ncbi:hypothetical protein [Nocardioides sp.]|uniref:hypothetical protein n=1 Tax=Nocardioides sp. TaxID=35761 RepID=UPI0039E3163E